MINMREEILSLLSGNKINTVPAFSGLIHVTSAGLESEGLSLHEVHHDAGKMARAAASTFKLTGMPSATLPLDLCAPAEVLGAEMNFYEGEDDLFPQVKKLLFQSSHEVVDLFSADSELRPRQRGRIPLICDAIGLTKEDIGDKAVISGLIPGPYTLLIYICKAQNLFSEMKSEPAVVSIALRYLTDFLADIANAYLEAGADFITIHDMGGSAGFIGPSKYEQFVFPSETKLIELLSKPCVLSVCGRMDKSLDLLAQTGAEAVSVDQLTDLKAAREVLKDTMLFGNIDPVATLWREDVADITEAVLGGKEAGVDAVWPGCDLVPSTPIHNIAAMLKG
jgi:[methyl-Co(III) methanol-specific corrinoid protein]:coenzyme M methyltransferase